MEAGELFAGIITLLGGGFVGVVLTFILNRGKQSHEQRMEMMHYTDKMTKELQDNLKEQIEMLKEQVRELQKENKELRALIK